MPGSECRGWQGTKPGGSGTGTRPGEAAALLLSGHPLCQPLKLEYKQSGKLYEAELYLAEQCELTTGRCGRRRRSHLLAWEVQVPWAAIGEARFLPSLPDIKLLEGKICPWAKGLGTPKPS